MNQLLIVMPFCAADGERCERLIEWIFHLNGRKANGHCLLVASSDIHPEQIEKNKISAGVAFDSFESVRVTSPGLNAMFLGAATHVQKHFRIPWFWMEPDCTPLAPNWLMALAGAYYAQPKRYAGTIQATKQAGMFGARAITYPADAYEEIKPLVKNNLPFNIQAGSVVVPSISKHYLVREALIETPANYAGLPNDCVAVHGDKNSIALNAKDAEIEAKRARLAKN